MGLQTFVNVARSMNDIASETILTDISMVVLGFMLVFAYVIIMLGKFSMVENRVCNLTCAFLPFCTIFLTLSGPFVTSGIVIRVHDNFRKLWNLLYAWIRFQSFTQLHSVPLAWFR